MNTVINYESVTTSILFDFVGYEILNYESDADVRSDS
jgi:hypothetical protein